MPGSGTPTGGRGRTHMCQHRDATSCEVLSAGKLASWSPNQDAVGRAAGRCSGRSSTRTSSAGPSPTPERLAVRRFRRSVRRGRGGIHPWRGARWRQGKQSGGEGEDVVGLSRRLRPQPFWWRVGRRVTTGQPFSSAPATATSPKSDCRGLPELSIKMVAGLHIAVQHAARMGGGQGVGDLDANLADPLFTGPVLGLEPSGQ